MPSVQDKRGDRFYSAEEFGEWDYNDPSPSAPVDPPHIVTMCGLILTVISGFVTSIMVMDEAPPTAAKDAILYGSGSGLVIGIVLIVASIYFDERRNPPVPPSAPE